MIGPIVDSGALALGGILGIFMGNWIPKRVTTTMPLIFGVVTIGIGASLVGQAAYLHIVVLALIVGTFLGELCHMEHGLELVIRKGMSWSKAHDHLADNNRIIQYVTLISALCFGSMGLFGAVKEGLTGNPEIMLIKAVLDLFTGIIFGASLGAGVSLIAIPQFLILATLYYSSSSIMPLVSESMLQDFSSTGGVIFLATGLRLCGIKIFPFINMLPALLLVLPLSLLWSRYFL